ncbi:hypothetical protein BD413DRAFT_63205 [Trametes elegans]|nr:hypothetical protein BD413DRAFT_63205 [Trametes elegans]
MSHKLDSRIKALIKKTMTTRVSEHFKTQLQTEKSVRKVGKALEDAERSIQVMLHQLAKEKENVEAYSYPDWLMVHLLHFSLFAEAPDPSGQTHGTSVMLLAFGQLALVASAEDVQNVMEDAQKLATRALTASQAKTFSASVPEGLTSILLNHKNQLLSVNRAIRRTPDTTLYQLRANSDLAHVKPLARGVQYSFGPVYMIHEAKVALDPKDDKEVIEKLKRDQCKQQAYMAFAEKSNAKQSMLIVMITLSDRIHIYQVHQSELPLQLADEDDSNIELDSTSSKIDKPPSSRGIAKSDDSASWDESPSFTWWAEEEDKTPQALREELNRKAAASGAQSEDNKEPYRTRGAERRKAASMLAESRAQSPGSEVEGLEEADSDSRTDRSTSHDNAVDDYPKPVITKARKRLDKIFETGQDLDTGSWSRRLRGTGQHALHVLQGVHQQPHLHGNRKCTAIH